MTGMNKSERKAYNWLIKKGYTDNQVIYQPNRNPDFICSDGTSYEVKRLYGNIVWMYDSQANEIKSYNSSIVVMSDTQDDPVTIISPSEIQDGLIKNGIRLQVRGNPSKKKYTVYFDSDTRKKLFECIDLTHINIRHGAVSSTVSTALEVYHASLFTPSIPINNTSSQTDKEEEKSG